MEIYSFSIDFGGNLKMGQLHQEILADSAITTTLTGITWDQSTDNVVINFASTISGAEKTALDGVVAAHVPDNSLQPKLRQDINVAVSNVKANNYTMIATHAYNPTIQGTLLSACIVSFAHPKIPSYSIRLFDTNNGLTLGSGTFSNTDPELNSITNLSNVPTVETLLEVHAKRNNATKKKISIQNIVFNYG